MLAQERLNTILEYVNVHGSAEVAQLCQATGASESTVRRDLSALAGQSRLAKVHGGAVALPGDFQPEEPDVVTKAGLQVAEKDRIARCAAAQVRDDDFVFLDAGTTTLRMVEYLGESKATFVTTGIACARRMVEKGLRAYVIGGQLKPRTEAIVGGVAIEMLAGYNFTKAFIGANGISLQRGFTTPDAEEARIKAKAVEQAYMAYVVADSTKFGKVSAVTICPLEKACIITDHVPDKRFSQHAVIKEAEESQ